MRNAEITLDDFRKPLQRFLRPGLMQRMLSLMPGMSNLHAMMQEESKSGMRRMIGMIEAMTPEERRNPWLIDSGRRQRIAMGSGVPTGEVKQLVKQFAAMKPIIRAMRDKPPLNKRYDKLKMQKYVDAVRRKLDWNDDRPDDEQPPLSSMEP
jgi:signal recognition particle subunit SRP54